VLILWKGTRLTYEIAAQVLCATNLRTSKSSSESKVQSRTVHEEKDYLHDSELNEAPAAR
jgi:hypothetical protein